MEGGCTHEHEVFGKHMKNSRQWRAVVPRVVQGVVQPELAAASLQFWALKPACIGECYFSFSVDLLFWADRSYECFGTEPLRRDRPQRDAAQCRNSAEHGGTIVSALHNGARVRGAGRDVDERGRPWAYVVPRGRAIAATLGNARRVFSRSKTILARTPRPDQF